MTYTSQAVVYGTAFLNTVIAALKTVPGGALVTGGKVRLSKDPSFRPTPANTIAELATNETDYSGYASGGVALVVGNPVNLSPSCQGAVTGVQFLATTATPYVSDQAYGYWVDDGTNVIMAEAFPAGVIANFAAPGAFLELILQLPMQAPQATI